VSFLGKKRNGIGVCYKCGKLRKLTRHHIYPVCFFGRGRKNNTIWKLCEQCHKKIEALIPKDKKMPKKWYMKRNLKWLRGEYNGDTLPRQKRKDNRVQGLRKNTLCPL